MGIYNWAYTILLVNLDIETSKKSNNTFYAISPINLTNHFKK